MQKSQIILISGLMLFCTNSTSFCMDKKENSATSSESIQIKNLYTAIEKENLEHVSKILLSGENQFIDFGKTEALAKALLSKKSIIVDCMLISGKFLPNTLISGKSLIKTALENNDTDSVAVILKYNDAKVTTEDLEAAQKLQNITPLLLSRLKNRNLENIEK